MIGISIATTWEFDATIAYFHVSPEERIVYRMVNTSRVR